MEYEQIRSERQGEVQVLTLNRPDRLNAWTPQDGRGARRRHRAAPTVTADVGAIVMTGEGRGFCAGADMEATFGVRIAGGDPGANTAEGQGGMPAGLDWVDLCRRSKPLIAAVNGAAVGIGMTMILPFDVIIASDKARFGMFFIKVGLVPELASTYLLVQRMGFGRASEMCLSGRLWSAEEVLAGGLVERVVAPDALLDRRRRAGVDDRRQPGAAAADDQAAAHRERGGGRPARGAEARERVAAGVLEDAGARRGGRRLHGEARASLPAEERASSVR